MQKLRAFLFFITLLSTAQCFSQKNICGDYIVPELKGTDVYKRLALKEDSSFEFVYFHNGEDKNSGKWKVKQDTLILFSYKDVEPKTDTLSGQESVIGRQDSIEIIFIDKFNKKPAPVSFLINRMCDPDDERREGNRYMVPKQHIYYIYLPYKYQIYRVKNKNANRIIIEINPLKLFFRTRVVEYKRSLLKDDFIIPIKCNGELSRWGKLKKQAGR